MNFYAFIPRLLNMSLTASVAIVFVLLLRLMLKKSPKVISYALWAVVLFRLLCPISIESSFSLFGLMDAPTKGSTTLTTNIEYVPEDIVHTEHPAVALPIPGISNVINSTLPSGREQLVADPLEAPVTFATYVWLAGVLVMAAYSVISYRRLQQKLLTASPLRDNIYLADEITSPFVMGLIRPKIYLPSEMDEREQAYIIRHEQHHIRRGDHIIKALAFLALSIHWFNPLVWVAFIYSSKDMEMSCDEAVVKKMGDGILADYTASLLSLATGKQIIAGMPLAFGEGDTKSRIRNLANWRKPAFWVVLISVVACIALAVGLLTNPGPAREFPINGSNVSELDTEQIIDMIAKAERLEKNSQLYVYEENLMINEDFDWLFDGSLLRFYYFKSQKTYSGQLKMSRDESRYFIADTEEWAKPERIYRLSDYLDALKYMPQDEIRQLYPNADTYVVSLLSHGSPSDYQRVITYTQNGMEDIDGWNIHLMVSPTYEAEPGGYYGSDEELLHLFYGNTDHQGYGGTLYGPDGTVITFPVDKGTEAAAYADFAARFSKEDILFDTDPNGKILLSEDFVGSRYVCFSMKSLDDAEGVPYPDIEDHVVSVDVADRWIEDPQPGTIYVLVPSSGNVSKADPETSREMLGPYLFDLPLYGHMNAENGFTKHYAAGTTVRISGEWRGDYPLSFVFSGEYTNEDVIAVVYSGTSKTITLPTDDNWTCSVSSNGGRTDGDFWLYVTDLTVTSFEIANAYDMNHNGILESCKITWGPDAISGSGDYRLSIMEEETEIWHDYAGTTHAGWNSIFAVKVDGEDYLLRYVPDIGTGIGWYMYELFSLDENGEEVLLKSNEVEFDLNFGGAHRSFDPAAIAAFLKEVHSMLNDESELLLSTDRGRYRSGGSGATFDSDKFWGDSFDYSDKSLEEILRIYAEEMSKIQY